MVQSLDISNEIIKVNCSDKTFRKLLLYPTELPGHCIQIHSVLSPSKRLYSRHFFRFPVISQTRVGENKGTFRAQSQTFREHIAQPNSKSISIGESHHGQAAH